MRFSVFMARVLPQGVGLQDDGGRARRKGCKKGAEGGKTDRDPNKLTDGVDEEEVHHGIRREGPSGGLLDPVFWGGGEREAASNRMFPVTAFLHAPINTPRWSAPPWRRHSPALPTRIHLWCTTHAFSLRDADQLAPGRSAGKNSVRALPVLRPGAPLARL